MDFKELTEKAGVELDSRQIRYLVAEGIMPRPDGGRKFPSYGQHHLDALRNYLSLREAGMSMAAILAARDAGGLPVVVHPLPGVTVTIAPDILARDADTDALSLVIAGAISDFMSRETPDADDR